MPENESVGGEPSTDVVAPAGAASVSLGGAATARLWHWYSNDQAVAATLFARCAKDLEEPAGVPPTEATLREHRSVVLASILSSSTFLEACLNELFASAEHPDLQVGGALPEEERGVLVGSGELFENTRLLDRFQLALYLLRKERFEKGGNPYQDSELLVTLRNALVHRKAEWSPGTASDRFTARFREKNISSNPYTSEGNPFFPDQLLSYGCARWAWGAALAFTDEFFLRVGVAPPYEGLRADLVV